MIVEMVRGLKNERWKVVDGSIWITDKNRTTKIDSLEKLENFNIKTLMKDKQ